MSDIWSGPNLLPFIDITAHWISTQPRKSAEDTWLVLTLRSELVGFHHIPGRHDGEYLAAVFLHVIDWLQITNVCR